MKHQLHIFPGFGIGGAQRRFAQLYHGLAGWRHSVISLDGLTDAQDLCGAGERLEVRTLELASGKGISPGNVRKLSHVIEEHRPDLLCTYNWGSIEAVIANRLGPHIPHLHFEDGFGPDEASRRSPARNFIRRLALRGRTVTVLPSKVLERIAKDEWKLPPGRWRYLPNGVDTDRFYPEPSVATHQKPVVGAVAALRPEKNMGRLLRIAGAGETLLIVGDGPERQVLADKAATLNLTADFTGAVGDTAPAYRGFDLFALTSDTEQMPLTVLEAMASGLPVLATDVGDVKDMVAEENRPFILPPAEEKKLATALRSLLADPALRARLGAANRQRAEERFSQTGMIAAYEKLFDELTG